MRRAAPVALAFLLLAVPAVDAAASGARAPIPVSCTPDLSDCEVRDVDFVASTSPLCSTSVTPTPSNAPCRFAAANEDGPRTGFTGEASAPTWTLWNLDGSTRQNRGADPASCPQPQPGSDLDDCDTDVTEIAISATGSRIAVAAQVGMNRFNVVVFDDTGAVKALHALPMGHVVNDLAIDPTGARVAVGATTGSAPNQDGAVHLLDAASNTAVWPFFATAEPVTTVDLTNGLLTAGAGPEHLRFLGTASTQYANSAIQGAVMDVDASTHSLGWSVAGHASGFIAVYSSHVETGRRQPSLPDYQKREAGETTSANAVAIRDDATMFAVGHEGGRLRLYSLDPASAPEASVTLLDDEANLGSIDRLAFSADGRYLVMLADNNLRMFYTGNNVLEEMWTDTRAGAGTRSAMAVDGRGEHVVLAVGESVVVYDAIHRIQATLGTATHEAGAKATYQVTYRNDGNRAEALTVSAAPPGGVTTAIEPSQFTLLPGATRQVSVTVDVPATHPPSNPLRIPLTASINGGTDGAPVSNLDLNVPTSHQIDFATDVESKGANLGGPAVFEVTATNNGNVEENVELRVDGLTGGWTAEIEPPELSLAPGESTAVTVSLQPPPGLANGARIDIDLTHGGAEPEELALTATVGAVFEVKVTAPLGTTLSPGVTAVINVTVRNDGNTRDGAVVSHGPLPAGWDGGFINGQSEFDVQDLEPCSTNPGACSRIVQLTLRPPAAEPSGVPVQVTITAKSVGDEAKASTARLLVTVVEPSTASSTTSGDGGGGNGIPGPGPLLAVLALALAALAVRRRTS